MGQKQLWEGGTAGAQLGYNSAMVSGESDAKEWRDSTGRQVKKASGFTSEEGSEWLMKCPKEDLT